MHDHQPVSLTFYCVRTPYQLWQEVAGYWWLGAVAAAIGALVSSNVVIVVVILAFFWLIGLMAMLSVKCGIRLVNREWIEFRGLRGHISMPVSSVREIERRLVVDNEDGDYWIITVRDDIQAVLLPLFAEVNSFARDLRTLNPQIELVGDWPLMARRFDPICRTPTTWLRPPTARNRGSIGPQPDNGARRR